MVYQTIGTHSGTFHCDEALAIGLLQFLDEFKSAKIIRSRDMEVLKNLDILVDVGSEYNVDTLRFDHHQRTFSDTFSPEHKVRLSSAGLIYKHFGRKILAKITEIEDNDELELVYNEIYESFILAVDAIDNGVQRFPTDVEPLYRDGTSLSSRVSNLNPMWRETVSEERMMELFNEAIKISTADFLTAVRVCTKSWLPVRGYVLDAINSRFDFHKSGHVVHFPEFVPWKNHFFTQKKITTNEDGVSPLDQIYVIVYESQGSYRYINVPLYATSFSSAFNVPSEWFGLRDAELDAVTGVEGGSFVHHSGFTGGAKSMESLMKMMDRALEIFAEREPEKKKHRSEE